MLGRKYLRDNTAYLYNRKSKRATDIVETDDRHYRYTGESIEIRSSMCFDHGYLDNCDPKKSNRRL